ncbi:MAG: ribosome-associated translation inhibitor RaiA [Nitrospirota bacterium]
MELIITGKKANLTPELKKYIEARSKKMEKYISTPLQTTITLKTEKHRQIAEAHVNINGAILQAQEETEEIHLSVDNVLSKIEKQLKKYKEKAVDHHKKEKPIKKAVAAPGAIMPIGKETKPIVTAGKETTRVAKHETDSIHLLTLEAAFSEMKLNKKEFLLFRSGKNRQLTLLYKKKGSTPGLIEFIDTMGAGR